MKIEKGIPMPHTKRSTKTLSETFANMEIGDSALATANELNNARQWFRKNERKITAVKEGDGLYRFWRIE